MRPVTAVRTAFADIVGSVDVARVLDEVLRDESLACGAVIDETGAVLARAGDFERFPESSLISSLLGPSGAARETYASLEGQSLPAIWGEGRCFAFVDRPTAGIAFVLFGVPARPSLAFLRPRSGEREAVDLIERSKRVSRKLRDAVT